MTQHQAKKSRLSDEDRALIRTIGGQLGQLLLGAPVEVPDLGRRDELGILANMVSRLARDLVQARARGEQRRKELERKVEELQSAYDTQEKLLAAVRHLPSPILGVHRGVLLVPLTGGLDRARIDRLLDPLARRIAEDRPEVVILDVTDAPPADAAGAKLLLRVERALRPLGVRSILAGVAPASGRAGGVDLSAMIPCADTAEALVTALDLVGYRLAR